MANLEAWTFQKTLYPLGVAISSQRSAISKECRESEFPPTDREGCCNVVRETIQSPCRLLKYF